MLCIVHMDLAVLLLHACRQIPLGQKLSTRIACTDILIKLRQFLRTGVPDQ